MTVSRRWFRFSIRTMLVVVTVCCCWLAWSLRLVNARKSLLGDDDVASVPADGNKQLVELVCKQHPARTCSIPFFAVGLVTNRMFMSDCRRVSNLKRNACFHRPLYRGFLSRSVEASHPQPNIWLD